DGGAQIRLLEPGKISRTPPRKREGVSRRQRRQSKGDRVRAGGEHCARRRASGATTRARLHGSRPCRHNGEDGRDLYGRDERSGDADAVHKQIRRHSETDRGGMGRGRKALGEIPAAQELITAILIPVWAWRATHDQLQSPLTCISEPRNTKGISWIARPN